MLQRFLNDKIKQTFLYLIFSFPFWGLGGCSSPALPHNSNSFREEYSDGNVKKECKFIKAINETHYMHHCLLYHPGGNLAEEGDFINDTIATGWHTYYRVSGSIKSKREYLQLAPDKIFLNQVFRFEVNGDTDKTKSNYYSMWFDSDTVKLGDDINVHFNLDAPYFKGSYIQVTISDEKNGDEMLPSNKTLSADFNFKAINKGSFQLKGFIDEIQKFGQTGDTMQVQKRTLYFSKTYFVK